MSIILARGGREASRNNSSKFKTSMAYERPCDKVRRPNWTASALHLLTQGLNSSVQQAHEGPQLSHTDKRCPHMGTQHKASLAQRMAAEVTWDTHILRNHSESEHHAGPDVVDHSSNPNTGETEPDRSEFEASLYYTVTLYSNTILHKYHSRLFGTTKYQVVCFNENPNTLDNSRSHMSAQVTGDCIALHGP